MSINKYLSSLLAAVMIAGAPALVSMAHAQESETTETTTVEAPAPADDFDAAPASLPVAAPVANVEKEVVDNPYGINALWEQGDFVSKGTLIILLIMSFGSWYILAIKLYEQYKLRKQAQHIQDSFWQAGSLKQGMDELNKDGPFHYLAETSIKASADYQASNPDAIDYNSWLIMTIQRAVDSVQNRMQDGLSFLASVGSVAPFVGLFGTVWGIYHALTAIGISGQASIDKVAGPVGEALIMTAIGLAVAVPAVLSYNWLVRRNKQVMEDIRVFSAELHSRLLLSTGRGA